ncbi:GGDEF domain-containing protein [Xanthobacter sp. KR7-65]|uniref:GGDEF domain-containing protein n=1 Tax=Xanthobacter sp. KR7-65 TaxID=3156612 RepID=UPI0032B5597E
MDFQVQTVLSVSALVGAMLAGLQLMAGWRLQASCLFAWALANLFLTAGCVFIAARPQVGLAPSVLIGNACILLGMGLIYSGIRAFDDRPMALTSVAVVASAGVLGLAWSLASGDHLTDRVTIMSILVAGWSAFAARALMETPGSGPIISRLGCSMVLICLAAGYVMRAIAAQLGLLPHADEQKSLVEVVTVIAGLVLAIGWTFGSLFMVLEKLASVDDLTGLFNRRTTLRSGAGMMQAARTRRQPFSLLLADLDHFKSVNDRFGHDVGDLVLKRFAAIVPRALRPQDVVGRHGGEEFCILLPGADAAGALVTAERLRQLVQEQLGRVAGREIGVTLTVGAATYVPGRPGCDSIESLINAADTALYSGKALGRNRVALADADFASHAIVGPGLAAQPSR